MNKSSALIKYKRLNKKITQKEMAEKLGISSQQLMNIERSVCIIPGKYVSIICRELKINKRYLINHIMDDIRMKFYRDV